MIYLIIASGEGISLEDSGRSIRDYALLRSRNETRFTIAAIPNANKQPCGS